MTTIKIRYTIDTETRSKISSRISDLLDKKGYSAGDTGGHQRIVARLQCVDDILAILGIDRHD